MENRIVVHGHRVSVLQMKKFQRWVHKDVDVFSTTEVCSKKMGEMVNVM